MREYSENTKRLLRILQKNWYVGRKGWVHGKYKITEDTLLKIIVEQDGYCAICQADLDKKNKWAIDHDDKTGAVRGVLCYGCNTAIGKLKHDTDILERAIAYLRKEHKWT